MEVDNAFNQADREIATRFDFKNTDSKIEKSGEKFLIEGQSEEKAKAVLEKQSNDDPKAKTKKGSSTAFTFEDAICLLREAKIKIPDHRVQMVF